MPVFEATAHFGVYAVAANKQEAYEKLIAEARAAAPGESEIFITDIDESEDLSEEDFE